MFDADFEDESEDGYKDHFNPQLDSFKQSLKECLDGIQSTGTVAFSKSSTSFVNPGLVVADTLIPLPLLPRDAETIKGACRQAPFGKGDDTVVDTSVRNTWELDHTQFKCSNPQWQAYASLISKDAGTNLGMSDIMIDPYKLLLYEEGSFFKPHKDSEKVPGMIGTLVICLPSKHQGGDVYLSHAGRKYVFNTDRASEFSLTSLSWFSDVTHEIKPLTSGYRLVLTYNIIHVGGTRMSAGLVGEQTSHVRCLLSRWKTELPKTKKLIYMLDHKYTQASLSLKNLKGRDKGVCHSLYETALHGQFAIFLAQMNRSEYGMDGYNDYDMDEGTTNLEQIKTCDGFTICEEAYVKEQEILSTDVWDRNPDSEDEAEHTGNASMPQVLRYHDTVAIIVPIRHLGSFLSKSNPRGLMIFTSQSLHDRPDDHFTHNILLTALEKAIVDRYFWTDHKMLLDVVEIAVRLRKGTLFGAAVRSSLKHGNTLSVFPTMARHMDEAFRKDPNTPPDWDFWLSDVATQLRESPLTMLAEILPQLDLLVLNEDLKTPFQAWKKQIMIEAVESKSKLEINDYDFLVSLLDSQASDSTWLVFCFGPLLARRGSKLLIYKILRVIFRIQENSTILHMGSTVLDVLAFCRNGFALQIEDIPKRSYSTEMSKFQCPEAATLREFLKVLHQAFSNGLWPVELLGQSCTNIHSSLKYCCPIIVRHFILNLISILTTHKVEPLPSVRLLLVSFLQEVLLFDLPQRPDRPQGWKRKSRACNPYCGDCRELNAFLGDSGAQTWEFRMVAAKRQHIEKQLPHHLFYCRTDKSSSPQVLIVTKQGNEYEVELRLYRMKLTELTDRVSKFKGEYVKSLLGDDRYDELILLKKLKGSEGAQQTGKRRADEDLAGSSASKPKFIE
ncbi:hypothetical protein GGR53DRAFT_525222, partial [Hypoxylon sp. FL1150]